MTSSLVFCVGPLTVLGSINDGLGNGADQLYLKSALDGFAAIAFAASLGWGVGASVLALLVVQGSLTALGAGLGDVLTDAQVAALTTTGGLLLVGRRAPAAAAPAAPGRRPAARAGRGPGADRGRRGRPLDDAFGRELVLPTVPTRCSFVAPNLPLQDGWS